MHHPLANEPGNSTNEPGKRAEKPRKSTNEPNGRPTNPVCRKLLAWKRKMPMVGPVRPAARDENAKMPNGPGSPLALRGELGYKSYIRPVARGGAGGLRRSSWTVSAPAGHHPGQVGEGRGLVRDRHGGDEMLLEAGLDRGLDLLDPARPGPRSRPAPCG